MGKVLQINIPIESMPHEDLIDAAAALFSRASEHKRKKLWGRISVEVIMENGLPAKVTVMASEVYAAKDLESRKLKLEGQ